ncbi:hypothetical protein V2H45_05955 [Tumidithrix elongata RA019]|uniref:Virion structural protein n=1 Tax=Tumidithrix elongata BACA0141 TaxID=2716417 RepID=A0AAW9PR57_9CYAN|nr:hypothetical protein [Tumidithrix elongata RA019]
MSFEYFDAAGNATNDGVFIPVAALPGVLATELAAAQPATTKLSKAIFAILNQIYDTISPTTFNALGFTASKANPSGAGTDLLNQNFSFTAQKLINFDTDTVSQVPVPSTGANTGLGKFSISDIFAGAAVVAAAGTVAGAGIVIPTSLLLPYTSLTHAGLTISGTSDNRDWFAALFDFLGNDLPVRSSTVASAVTARTASAIAATTIPAAYVDATAPTSGILVADLPARGLVSKSYSLTIQLILDQSSQSFDVNSVIG